MTKDELQVKAQSLKRAMETLIDCFKIETGYAPIIEIKTVEIEGYGDQTTKRFSQVVVKVEL